MNRSINPLLLALLAVTTVNAQQSQTTISREPLFKDYLEILDIKETHTYGVYEPADSPEAWGTIYSLTPGPDAGVLVTDPRMNLVYHVVPDQGVVRTFGAGEGDGPGEFRYATAAAWNGLTEVFVADRRQLRTSVFTLDGNYKRSFPNHDVFTVAIDSEGIMWVTGISRRNPNYLRRYDTTTGEYLGELGGSAQGESRSEFPATGMVATSLKRVFSVKSYPYEVVEFSSAGDVLNIFSRQVRWMRPPVQDEIGVWINKGGAIGGLGCFPDGKVIVFVGRILESEEPGFEGYFDVFDTGGKWLTTIPSDDLRKDRMAIRMTVASDGALWINWHGDYSAVTRYELSFR